MRFLLGNRQRWLTATLVAASGYAVATLVSLAVGFAVEAERRPLEHARLGTLLAQQLALQAADALLRQDRAGLGARVHAMAGREEVRRVALHTVDGQPLVVAGDAPAPGDPAFTQSVTVANATAAEIRLTLNAAATGVRLARALAIAWPFWLTGLALTVAGAAFGDRLLAWWRGDSGRAPSPNRSVAPAGDEATAPATVVVASLFGAADADADARALLLEAAGAAAQRTAAACGIESAVLPGAGHVLVLRDPALETGLPALQAAQLLRDALRIWLETAPPPAAAGAYRFAVHHADDVPVKADWPRAEVARDAVLLASLARDGEVVVSATALRVVATPSAVRIEAIANPAAQVLDTAARPAGILRALAEPHAQPLRARAAEIAESLG